MSSIIVAGDTSGSVTLQAPAVSGSTVLTLPAQTGTVMVNGPAFSALMAANQTITANVYTKVQFSSKEFDTNTNYDATTNYRFTPAVAGYYQVNASVYPSTTVLSVEADIYKNGSMFKRGFSTSTNGIGQVSVLVYMNGATDYIECYTSINGTTPTISNNNSLSWFQAFLARSA